MGKKSLFGTLFLFEIKKILKNRFTVILLIVIAAYSLLQGVFQAEQMGDYESRTVDLERAIDGREIDNTLFSELVEAADEYGTWWNESNCTYNALCDWVRKIVDYGKPLADYDADSIYQIRQDTIKDGMEMCALTEGEERYWEEKEALIDKPLVWHSFDEMLGLYDIVQSIPLIMLFVITLLLSQIFAGEVKDKTDPLLRCTRGGWGITYVAKIAAAVVSTFLLTVFFGGISVTTSLLLWGSNGWNGVVQNLMPLTSEPLTMGAFFGRQILVAFAACLLLTAATCFLSECFNNPVVVMGAVFGGFLLILAGSREIPMIIRPLSQFLYLLSPVDMTSPNVLYEFRLVGFGGHYLTALQFAPILYAFLSVLAVVIGYFVYLRKNRA
ncbi:ABC transporter permease [Butyrivibrio fibrisolvens]|uniref:ABC transporter permease n=1 Tax=Butyrivibrio fibrisolvens TaxID=831 RepID=UPI0003B411AF|nr:ABC transporter permease [Butyrivibrio fibrisolvens]